MELQTIMKKILLPLLMISTTPHAAPAIKVYMDYHNPLCNRTIFNQEVNSNGFAPTTKMVADYGGVPRAEVTAKAWEVKRAPITAAINAELAKIQKVKDVLAGKYRWTVANLKIKTSATKLITASQAVISAKKQLLVALNTQIFHQIEDDTECLVFEGTNEAKVPQLFSPSVPIGGMEGSLDYTSFASAFPFKGDKQHIYLIDGVILRDFTHPNHLPRIAADSKSFVKTIPSVVDSIALSGPNHGSAMLFQIANLTDGDNKPTIHVGVIAGVRGGIAEGASEAALNWAAGSGTHGTINLSSGFEGEAEPLEYTKAKEKAAVGDMLLVAAIGNTGKKSPVYVKDDPSAITVGHLVDGELRSSYGANGPDIVIEEEGEVPFYFSAFMNRAIYNHFRNLQSSGAAAITSAMMSRVRNVCPKATVPQIREAVFKTAIKIPEAKGRLDNRDAYVNEKNSHVRHGILDPEGAARELKNTVCRTKTSWTYYTPGASLNNYTGRWNPKTAPVLVAPMTLACAELGGTLQPIEDKGDIYCTKTGAALHPNICLGVTGPERGVIKPCNKGLPTN